MAWRWQWLLGAHGIHDRLPWLVRAYLVSYAAGQILPTSIGGDAMRIFETSRRHPGTGGPVAGSVLLERALGGAATLALGAVGLVLAVGHYDVGAYLWIEAAFVVATIVLAFVLFSSSRGRCSRGSRRCCGRCGSTASCAPSTRRSTPTGRRPAARRRLRADARGPGRARARDLGGRGGGRHRPLARVFYVMGPLLLPRAARAVHAERASRCARPSSSASSATSASWGPGVRGRVPVLSRDDRALASRPRHPRSGRTWRSGPAVGDVAVVVVTYNAMPWLERCLESVREYPTVVVDHGSTDGRSRSARRFPTCASSSRRTTGSAQGGTAACAESTERGCSCPERRRLGRSATGSRGSSSSRTSGRARRSSGRGS